MSLYCASPPPLFLPATLLQALRMGADCYICVSGGKDSQAMAVAFTSWFRAQGFAGQLTVIYADLGRAEWHETPTFIENLCFQLALPLLVVRRDQGDLLDRLTDRMHTLEGTEIPFWPTRGQRYCTSDLKRTVCDKAFRKSALLISFEGIRADESEERAEKEPLSVRRTITGTHYKLLSVEQALATYAQEREAFAGLPVQYTLFGEPSVPQEKLPRLALTCYPLFYWTIDDVWTTCGTSREELAERRLLYRRGVDGQDATLRAQAVAGWPAHPAYVYGANRLSCSLCILADIDTLRAGAEHQPAYYRALVWLEIQSGFPFQPSRWLADVCPALLTDEQVEALGQLPRHIAWLAKKKSRRVLPLYQR